MNEQMNECIIFIELGNFWTGRGKIQSFVHAKQAFNYWTSLPVCKLLLEYEERK